MAFFKSRFQYHAPRENSGSAGRPWRTGFWRRAPKSGLLALIVGLLCGIATFIVLETSDGVPLNQWQIRGHNVQPAVVISILATLANSLFRYAFSEGAKVSWWVEAQEGSSVAGLHQAWDSSQSVLAGVPPWKPFHMTAVASLFTLLLLIDGLLLQRASTVGLVSRQMVANLSVPISASPFIMGARGVFADHDVEPTLYNPLFARILQEYRAEKPLTLPNFGCKGQCELTIEAPGFDIECQNWTSPYRLMNSDEYIEFQESFSTTGNSTTNSSAKAYDGPAYSQTMFSTNVTFDTDANELWHQLRSYRTGNPVNNSTMYYGPFPPNTIMLSSMVKSTSGGNGSLAWRSCVLREALQRYPIVVRGNVVTLQPVPLQENHTVYQVIRASETGGMGNWPSTLGGIWMSTRYEFEGKANLQTDAAWYAIRTKNSSPLTYMNSTNVDDAASTVNSTWIDPIDDMISMIRELSLRTAITTTSEAPPVPGLGTYYKNAQELLTSPSLNVWYPNLANVNRTLSQEAHVLMTYDETVYHSNFDWAGGAITIIGLTFFAILPIFNHWWRLGRKVSMSPIETAKAFDAPLFRHADDNSEAKDLVNNLGDQRIQYGAASSGESEEQYYPMRASGETPIIEISESSLDGLRKRRLQFGTEGTVDIPLEGETFAASRGSTFVVSRGLEHSHSDLAVSSVSKGYSPVSPL